ncbi:hypothetical protein VitviT2T_018200 [Vitis vinifera]|uniref:Heavy metal-associated isoprenylated plant protein 16 n=1 Tax=Vitis vinifera TaxID=29760 RepID=A0ABY9CWS3_VITVI|nr:heavy metal-associated isoprenylated plant protein 16 [Vitis vinifera]WJZ99784.1 hypothetical protein VitviT2T_018200 [Vitis vinifera]|eukprot:XP_002266819.2 PREDICTED: heavy metal-associated isoprenylated plant protein 16-like [Vitis vinifera]
MSHHISQSLGTFPSCICTITSVSKQANSKSGTETMKKKMVIKVTMNGEKSRSKSLKVAVGVAGVESAALQGQEKNQIEVIGEGIDAVALTTLLRKKVGFAELVSVSVVGEKKEEKKDNQGKKNEPSLHVYMPSIEPYYHEYTDSHPDSCSIM